MAGFLRLNHELHGGMSGPGVRAAQRAIYAMLGPRHAHNLRRGSYGAGTIHDVMLLQHWRHLPMTGRVDAATWRAIEPHVDAFGRLLVRQSNRAWVQAQAAELETHNRGLVVHWALYMVAHVNLYRYAEVRPILRSWLPPRVCTTDCSGSFTTNYHMAGCPDPNGLGYNGEGNTTTLQEHGSAVADSALEPADAHFYSSPAHVVTCILSERQSNRKLAVTFGSWPPREVWLDQYRTDHDGSRRYAHA